MADGQGTAGTEEEAARRSHLRACALAALAALALFAALAGVASVVSQPLGVVAAFALGAFVVASRIELGAALTDTEPGSATNRVPELWLAILGVAIAVGVPALAIAL